MLCIFFTLISLILIAR